MIREYSAPIQTVWTAWTDPKILDQWWGPRGFVNRTHNFEACPGGAWQYTMQGPDKVEYQNFIRFIEVDNLRRLVYDHGTSEGTDPFFRVTVTFQEADGKTIMAMSMTFPTVEEAQASRVFIKQAGGETTWDKLEEYLIKKTYDRDVFVINRTFEAPITKLADIWTNPALLSQWLPTDGTTMQFIREDLRPGGSCFYVMNLAQGGQIYGRSSYLTIDKPHTIIYTQQFCDKNEKIIRPPMSPTWPETLKTTVTLASEGGCCTRVNLVWEPDGPVQPECRETFVNGRPSMTQGWRGSFDKLEVFVAKFMNEFGTKPREKAPK